MKMEDPTFTFAIELTSVVSVFLKSLAFFYWDYLIIITLLDYSSCNSSHLLKCDYVRKTTSMQESNAMTIEFLRARLLSERSVSKTARQRADELAKKVAELEKQLKFVSLQRKKAEKATADVLAILENHGISDVSEEFDSCSDQEESPHDFKARNGSSTSKVTSSSVKLRKNETEAYSSSEVESSPSTGRSLSWRSSKDSQHALEKKNYMDSVRRRASFGSNSLSARRVGKSCRRIRHRDTRSMEDSQNDGTEKAACSGDAFNGSDGEHVALREYENGKNQLESSTLRSNSETQKMDGRYFDVHERDDDMESALQHQAQLIGQYEEEEKAQREWEEKFRENNSGTQCAFSYLSKNDKKGRSFAIGLKAVMRVGGSKTGFQPRGVGVVGLCHTYSPSVAEDSCDPGNHSDVTEERYEMKSPELSRAAGTSNSDNQETKQEQVDACFSEKPETSKRSLQNENIISCESSASEFSFPMSREKNNQEFLGIQHNASQYRSQQFPPMVQTTTQSSTKISPYEEKSTALSTPPKISLPLELAVVPQDNLGSVLEALKRAKSSLNQKLNNSPPTAGRASGSVFQPSNNETNKTDSFQIPFLSEPFDSRSAFSSDLFLTDPYRPFTPERPFSQPRLSEGPSSSNRMNRLDSYTNPVLPSVKDSYPFLPDVTLRVPLNEGGASRNFPSSERGLPPVMRLSSYDEHVRPDMYR
ncbi:hypothetical protein DH2020_010554 [Rehmannia glutinosa]|uniref:Uncharacterized protein n=1 Tax=Rehmannia glutinosa TaxID=99300 RepID=A0ABR0XB10_REHGL